MTTALLLMFITNTQQFNLPAGLLAAVCYTESGFNTRAIHKQDGASDSIGICQIKLHTARYLGFRGTQEQLMVPAVNIHFAAKYLHHHFVRYKSPIKAVIAYNMGHAKKELTSTKYSDKVIKYWRKNNDYAYRN